MKLKKLFPISFVLALFISSSGCSNDNDEKNYSNIFGYIDGSSISASSYMNTSLGFSVTGNVLFTDYDIGDCVVARFTTDDRKDGEHYIGRNIFCTKVARAFLDNGERSANGEPLEDFAYEFSYPNSYLGDNVFISVYPGQNTTRHYFPMFFYDRSVINPSFDADNDVIIIDVQMQEVNSEIATAKSFVHNNYYLYALSLANIRSQFDALGTFSKKQIEIQFRYYNTNSQLVTLSEDPCYLLIK